MGRPSRKALACLREVPPRGTKAGTNSQTERALSSLALPEFAFGNVLIALNFSNKPPSEALTGGLPVHIWQLVR